MVRMNVVITIMALALGQNFAVSAQRLEDMSDTASVLARAETVPGQSSVPPEIDMSDYQISLIGHAHIDLGYRWRWNEVVHRVGPDTFRGVLDLMEEEPGLTFAQSQMALYEAMQDEYPGLFKEITARIADGRWAVVGGMWSEPDMMIPCGESFIRQLLIGKHYAREQLGVEDIDILWVPDAFCGQVNTLPKILSRCGIKYYLFGRGAPPDKQIFLWESPDGSRMLAYGIAIAYSWRLSLITPQTWTRLKEWYAKAAGVSDMLVLYGEGDHGGGPRATDVEAKHALDATPGAPKMRYCTPQHYFETVLEPMREKLPVHKGTLGGIGGISYTSQARAKQGNRRAENLLLTAEKFNTIGTFYQRKPNYPRVDFDKVWKPVLFNQFHDILPGTSNGRVYDDADEAYEWVLHEGEELLVQGLESIAGRVDTTGDGIPLLVFNPLSWRRTDVVETTLRFVEPTENFRITDARGHDVLWQKVDVDSSMKRWRVVFLAEDVPSIGYKMFRVVAGSPGSRESTLHGSVSVLENAYIRARLDDHGLLRSLYDKKSSREMFADTGNLPVLMKESKRSSSWGSEFTGETVALEPVGAPELLEAGPVRATVRSRFRSHDSEIMLDTVLCSGAPRLEFRMSADWYDKDATLMVSFPSSVDGGAATFETPYGFDELPPDGTRQCAQQWIDLSNESCGLSLLNDAKYEFYIEDRALRMGVLRGARDMDPHMDEGFHSFRYALYPHGSMLKDAETVHQAFELNNPMIAMQESHHEGHLPAWGNRRLDESLPAEKSFVSVTPENVIVTALKLQQGAWTIPAGALVVRLYETTGRTARCELTLPFDVMSVSETDHLENVLSNQVDFEGNIVRFAMAPREVKTLKVVMKGSDY
jgi:alpha-mannosidase